jgi:hypothetical protein
MNINMGNQRFRDVAIPLLWGKRAVVQDRKGRLSVIDLSGDKARLEVLGDEPAPGVEFEPAANGFVIVDSGVELYSYTPSEKLLQGLALRLPECQIAPAWIRVGSNRFAANAIVGMGVGIAVDERSVSLGAPLPANLARLAV